MINKFFHLILLCLAFSALITCQNKDVPGGPEVEIWHGLHQKVGHLGMAQDDFNVMGKVMPADSIASLTYRLNKGPNIRLNFGEGTPGFRRFAELGHFNADIPIAELHSGENTVEIIASDGIGRYTRQEIIVDLRSGSYPLPVHIDWKNVTNPQDVGQYVDGHWELKSDGLRTRHMGYDRIFLIGEKDWQDYEITVPIVINQVSETTSHVSGGNGLGILFRFTGHINGGHRNFPKMQPKWGYQPFGAITWLRWDLGKSVNIPNRQFYPGDSGTAINHGQFPVEPGVKYWMKAKCHTLPDKTDGSGVSVYSYKIWRDGKKEPARWDWQETQVSGHANRNGGVALLAHHVDATFGNIRIESPGNK